VSQATPLPRIAFLGNYPPRLCGIATFTRDLCEAIARESPRSDCFVSSVNDRKEGYGYAPLVRVELQEKDLDSYRRAADFLNFNNADVLSVQHEFGIYGGHSGSHLLSLLKEVRMPVVSTLHTILADPNPTQKTVMEELCRRSDRLIVMAQKGEELLREVYAVEAHKIDVIPHGIPAMEFLPSDSYKAQFGVEGKIVLLTFGLLGPGKGIEYAIQALPKIIEQHPNVVYLILGATHPHLIAKEGERYRLSLERLADECGIKSHVIFYDQFVSASDLQEFIGATDVYLTPYLNEAQITSGTLAQVFGAGKAVVSTPYWHAKELLAGDRGVLVPFRDSSAIADGVCALITNGPRMETIRSLAYDQGKTMRWPAVAAQYLASFQHACADRRAKARSAFSGWTLGNRPYTLPPLQLNHIRQMSDGTGIFQHAIFTVPNFHEGYCVDDNARAYILCNLLDDLGTHLSVESYDRLSTTYLAFLAAALDYESGRFRNFMSHSRQWLEEYGSEDSHARSLWAVGTGAGRSRNEGRQRLAAQLFERGLPVVRQFTSPRSWCFILLGIHEYLRYRPGAQEVIALRAELTARLLDLWDRCATEHWPWFESSLSYDNARFSQALILSGAWMKCARSTEIGLRSLRWLVSIQKTQEGNFRPIGNNGFYQRDGCRANFDQQPVEAQAMVSACLEAFYTTKDPHWQLEAKRAFEWFLGRNDVNLPLYDFISGGCSDGLHETHVSENQGAESTLAFHLALAEMNQSAHVISHSP